MLMLALVGVLVVMLLVSLLMLPLACWLAVDDVLRYARPSIAAMGWLWLMLVPLIPLVRRIIRYFHPSHRSPPQAKEARGHDGSPASSC